MSHEAYDLINKLLIQTPLQRSDSTGAGEAAFIPSTQDDEDKSFSNFSYKLPIVEFLRSTTVCTSWNSVLGKDTLHLIRPSPWLFLPSDAGEASDTLTFRDFTVEEGGEGYHRRFSSLGSLISSRRCFGSKDGWLVTLDKTDLQPRLFNPLTKEELSLPSLFTIPEDKRHRIKPSYAPDGSIDGFYNDIIQNFASPAYAFRDVYFDKIFHSSNDPLGTAVVIYGYFQLLALARPGDETWVLGPQLSPYHIDEFGVFQDVYYHEEEKRFYTVTHLSTVLAFDLNGQNIKMVCPPERPIIKFNCRNYITFLSGTLLRIERVIAYESPSGKTTRISVFKLPPIVTDSSFSEWLPVKDLGDFSLFIGYNHTFSLHHTIAPGIKPNCIYFTFHSIYLSEEDANRDVGLFDLHNNCFQYFHSSDPQPSWPPSIWFTPALT